MPSKRESALAGLATPLSGIAGVTFKRNWDLPTEDEDLGGDDEWVILRDGDPGEPEVVFSPLTYYYQHEAEIEVTVTRSAPGADLDSEMDAVLVKISDAVNADTTLGGTVDIVEVGQPIEPEVLPAAGKPTKTVIVPAIMTYATTDPLN